MATKKTTNNPPTIAPTKVTKELDITAEHIPATVINIIDTTNPTLCLKISAHNEYNM